VFSAGTAHAFNIQPREPSDYASYRNLVMQVIGEIDSGSIKDVAMASARQDVMIGLGVNIARDHADIVPDDKKIIELIIAEIDSFKPMTADQIDARWGDTGTAGDSMGRPMRDLPQFSATHSALDVIFHPARVRSYFKDYEKTQAQTDLLDSRGELMEALHHLQVLEKEKDNPSVTVKPMRIK
jgi:hypothetical protein